MTTSSLSTNPLIIDLDNPIDANPFAIIGKVSRIMQQQGQPPHMIALFRRFYVDEGYPGLLEAASAFGGARYKRDGVILGDDDMPW